MGANLKSVLGHQRLEFLSCFSDCRYSGVGWTTPAMTGFSATLGLCWSRAETQPDSENKAKRFRTAGSPRSTDGDFHGSAFRPHSKIAIMRLLRWLFTSKRLR